MKRHKTFLFFCLAGVFLLSIVQYADSSKSWFVDIISHFKVQYAMLSLVFLALSLWKRILPLGVLAMVLFVLNAGTLLVSGGNAKSEVSEQKIFKVYSANIKKDNHNYKDLAKELNEVDAEIMLLIEVTPENIKPLKSIIQKYRYRIINLNTGPSTGTVLVSEFPVMDHKVIKYSDFGNMLVTATIEIHGRKVSFYGVHFPRPVFIQNFAARSEQIISLASQINEDPFPVIMAGDFNSTPYSPVFRKLLKNSGLKDSRDGFGWQPTWPTYLPLLWLPIDHILVSHDIHVHDRTIGSRIGSDHYPVQAKLSFTP